LINVPCVEELGWEKVPFLLEISIAAFCVAEERGGEEGGGEERGGEERGGEDK
jgi:hypothetical protein